MVSFSLLLAYLHKSHVLPILPFRRIGQIANQTSFEACLSELIITYNLVVS